MFKVIIDIFEVIIIDNNVLSPCQFNLIQLIQKMKSLISKLLFLLCSCVFAQVNKPIGINLSFVNDYSTELVFTDAFKQSRFWISANADNSGPWSTGIDIPLNNKGFPIQIPYDNGVDAPQKVRTLLLWDIGNAVPTGQYRLLVEGTGQVELKFGASGVYNCPIDTYVNVSGSVSIEIINSDINDPISDIKFIYPNYSQNFQQKTFTDEFLTFLDDFQVIRYMNWVQTNNSNVETWNQRAKYDYFTQAQDAGVAWEYIIELANLSQKNLWINIPHKADDNYIQQLAIMFQNQLNPNLKIYLEYSNEVWNGIFSQHYEAAQLASALGYTGTDWERAWKYTAKRSADVFSVFQSVFSDDSRLVKVIPSQAANSWLSNQLITFFNDPIYNPTQVSADALAIAPYFAGNVANEIVADGVVDTITIEEIVDRMEASLSDAYQYITSSKQVSDSHSLDLISYEGGQHLVGTGGNVNINDLTQKLILANHHPDLEDVYCQYLDFWYNTVGELFAHYSSHRIYSKWGSWGVKETMDDITNPKYLALQHCVFDDNILNTSNFEQPSESFVFPNPNSGTFYLNLDKNLEEFEIYNIWGQPIKPQISKISKGYYEVTVKEKGVIFCVINFKVIKVIVR